MTDRTLGWLIERAISWETAAHDLYASWARSAEPDSAARDLWAALAHDEATHAALLSTALASMPADRLAAPLGPKDLAMVDAVEALLRIVDSMPLDTLDDAYETAHALESSEVNAVFTLVLTHALEGEDRQALVVLLAEEHVDRLYRFGELHDRAQRRAIRLRT